MAAAVLILAMAQVAVPWGRLPVHEVRIVAPTEVRARAADLLAFRPGEVITRSDVRAGVQALLASGEFLAATVRAEVTAAGLVLEVEALAAERVEQVQIEGLPGALRRRVQGIIGLSPGAVLDRGALAAALEEARRVVRAAGYPEAQLEVKMSAADSGLGVSVLVTAALGAPLTLTGVEAPGSDLHGQRLEKVTLLRPGVTLTDARLERARRRLVTHLRRQGWWAAEVRAPRIERGERGPVVRLEVDRGPRYQLELSGMKLSKAMAEAALPFVRGGEPFEEGDLDSVLGRLARHLQEQGRLLATVGGEVHGTGDERVLRLTVGRIEKRPIRAVRFPGLAELDEAMLREKIGVRRGRPWVWGREPVTEETLEWDRLSVLAVLQREGWADAAVESPRLEVERGGVAVVFPVTMGPRRTVSELTIEGMVEQIPLPAMALRPAGPWSRTGEEEVQAALEGVLRDAGYLEARVGVASDCEEDRCAVRVTVTPGQQVILDRVVVGGLVRTSERVVRRLSTLRVDEPLGAARQLETQRRLLSLGIFQNAEVRPIPGQEHRTRRGVVMALKEAPLRSYGFGLGWDTEAGGRASASWSHLNPLGNGGALFAEGSYSQRRTRLQLTYREPSPLGVFGAPLWFSVYRYDGDFDTYSLRERGLWVEFGDRERRPGRVAVRYEYQIVNPDAPPEILSGLEREKQSLKIASLIPYAVWDSRDDVFSPTRGVLARAEVQSAFKVFLADAAFDKLNLSLAGYRPGSRGVVAGAVRAGVVVPRNGDRSTADNLLLPINVRYFAGGQVSHRAFALDRLGVPGQTLDAEGKPLGGAAMLLLNLEWRRRLAGAVGFNVFVDGGNVWASRRQVDLSDTRWGAGVGLRFDTPVGPIRLEYGWKLDRLPSESRGELFFALGNPF